MVNGLNTHEEALKVLMRKIKDHSEDLAKEIQSAIDSGIEKKIPPSKQGKEKKEWIIRSYSHKEAFNLALEILEAHYLIQPLLIESILRNMSKIKVETPDLIIDTKSEQILPIIELPIEIEIVSESHVSTDDSVKKPTKHLRADHEKIMNIKEIFQKLRDISERIGD